MRFLHQIDIRKRILIPIISISLIGALLTILQSIYLIQTQAEQTLKTDLYHTRHVIEEEFAGQEQKLMPETAFLTSDSTIREATERRDTETLIKKLIPIKVTFDIDAIKIIDAAGNNLVQLGLDVPTHKVLIDAGFDLERVSLFVRSNDSLWITAVAPIRTQSGKLVGLVLTGNKIDRNLLKSVEEKTGAEVAVEYGNLFVGSSNTAEDMALRNSFKEEVLKKGDDLIDGSLLYNSTFAVDRTELKTNGGNKAIAYILISTLNSNQAKRDNVIAILTINLSVLVVMSVIAYILSNSITKPLRVMSQRARLIADGNYKQRIDYTDIREIDELATSFNIMSEALEENRQKLEERAYTDSLTGLYNHRYFQDTLANEITRAERYKHPLSLIVIDIDDFKKVNDNFGHKKGDEALKLLTEKIKESTRGIDTPCRIGGEEFAIILPETASYEAFTVAERLRLSIFSQAIKDIGRITISLGIATFPNHGVSKETVIEAADTAMYHAKRQGKNLTFIYNGEPLVKLGPDDKWLTEESYFMDILHALVTSVESKNHYLHNHSEHVAMFVGLIGRELGLTVAQIEDLRIAGILHDIGKIAIPAFILQKTGPLTEEEFQEVIPHPIIGERILATLAKANLQPVLKAVLYHHERLDGSGYPNGLKGEDIPLYARVIAVADVFDVLISDTSYREALSVKDALDELRQESGITLDENAVGALIRVIEKDSSVLSFIENIEKRGGQSKSKPA